MQIAECYEAFGGSYQDVKNRLQNDALIQRLVIKFLADTSYEKLSNAIREEDYEEAFRAAHTLKGVSQNLSFDRLSDSSQRLTELLRNREHVQIDKAFCEQLFTQVSADYQAVVDAINRLEAQ